VLGIVGDLHFPPNALYGDVWGKGVRSSETCGGLYVWEGTQSGSSVAQLLYPGLYDVFHGVCSAV
jgi:hypothetical protein